MVNNVLHLSVNASDFSYAKLVFHVTFLWQRVSIFDIAILKGRIYNK